MKLQILQEYGGSIFDFDVIVINGTRWRKNQRISACILSVQGDSGQVNIGALSCIKSSLFVDAWLHKYHTDFKADWVYNSGIVPTNILVNSDHNGKCYNVYVDETIPQDPGHGDAWRWVDGNSYVNWKNKTAAHYYYKYFPNTGQLKSDDRNELMLMQNNSIGELFRHISYS